MNKILYSDSQEFGLYKEEITRLENAIRVLRAKENVASQKLVNLQSRATYDILRSDFSKAIDRMYGRDKQTAKRIKMKTIFNQSGEVEMHSFIQSHKARVFPLLNGTSQEAHKEYVRLARDQNENQKKKLDLLDKLNQLEKNPIMSIHYQNPSNGLVIDFKVDTRGKKAQIEYTLKLEKFIRNRNKNFEEVGQYVDSQEYGLAINYGEKNKTFLDGCTSIYRLFDFIGSL